MGLRESHSCRELDMQRQLIIVGGPEKGRTFSLDDGQTLFIGRGQASDTKINDPQMSRMHCRIQVDGGRTTLFDDGSSSGTLIGGVKISEQDLQPGDVFQVGDTQIRYVLQSNPHDRTTVIGNPILAPASFKAPASLKAPANPNPVIAPLKNLLGQSLAHYRLDSIIAEGNSGMVFKAHDSEKNRVAAVKVLRPDPTHSEEQKERFVRAMKTMLPVRSPHIVQLFNAGKNGPYCWCAMEYVDGESMTAVIRRIGVEGMLDWREAFRVAVHIGRALQTAFEQSIIHRNVTPANIVRRHADRVCLLGDLMLAKALDGSLAKQVTMPGQLIGEVAYMSPERTRDAQTADHRSDIYGLGATLYALLTGRPPFDGDSLPELIRLVRTEEPRKPKEFQLSINEMFQDSVLKMLAKRPDDRFRNPGELLRALDRVGRYANVEADWVEWSG
jgi:serine/threonine protein kinase